MLQGEDPLSRLSFALQLFDWTKSGSAERLLTFYRLSDAVAGRLKGLFVLFAGNLVKPLADLLRQTNTSQTGELHHGPSLASASEIIHSITSFYVILEVKWHFELTQSLSC